MKSGQVVELWKIEPGRESGSGKHPKKNGAAREPTVTWRQKHVEQLIAGGHYDKAAAELERQLEEQPGSLPLRHLHAHLHAETLVRDGQGEKAIAVFEGLVTDYVAKGDAAKAISVLKKIQRIDPEHSDLEVMLETLYEMQQSAEPVADAGIPTEVPGPQPPFDPGLRDRTELWATPELLLTEDWLDSVAGRPDDFSLSSLFWDLSKREIVALFGALGVLVKQPGSIIFTEGEPGTGVYILVHGLARVYRADAEGHNQQQAVLREGEVFGVPSVLSGQPRAATVTAVTECELLELDKKTFEDIVGSFPRVRELLQKLHGARPT